MADLHQLAVTRDPANGWRHWEELARRHCALPADQRLDMTLPRSKLAEGIAACRQIGDAATTIWGDLGVGSIHVTPLPDARRYATLKAQLATLGAQPCYEFGPPPQPPYPTLTPRKHQTPGDCIAALKQVVGDRYLIHHPDQLAVYGQDASIAEAEALPYAVALPASTAEVAALMQIAAAHDLPVVTRGAGSGLAGGAVPTPGCLVIGLNRMEQITIDRGQQVAHVGAGVITAELQRAAERVGLFYPPRSEQSGGLDHRRQYRLQRRWAAVSEIWSNCRLRIGINDGTGRRLHRPLRRWPGRSG